jgi:hypothetical protein
MFSSCSLEQENRNKTNNRKYFLIMIFLPNVWKIMFLNVKRHQLLFGIMGLVL